jgi:hypothetical protein
MPVDFTKVPIGTQVETAWGPGKIVSINGNDSLHAVEVSISEDDVVTYTADGKYYSEHTHPTLFLAPFEWPTQEQPEPLLPDLAVDAPIMVRNYEYESWGHRHFAAWKYGKVTTFTGGRTSFTENVTIDWEQWRLPTEEELKGIS